MEWNISKQIGRRVPIVEKSTVSYVNMEDITHITCVGHVSSIHLITGKEYHVARLLKKFEEELAPCCFLRVNRHTLVNIRHVDDTQRTKRLLHIGNITISVSKEKMSLLKKENSNLKNSIFAVTNLK